MSRNVLCLDWDARALRMVVARLAGGRMVLEDAHSHRLPDGLDPENPQALGEFIREMLRRHQWNYQRVIVDVPREKAVINRLALAPTPADEVAAAVYFQAMKELPFPIDSAVVDFVVMQRDERGLTTEVLLAAAPLEALSAVQATCTAAGLTPARIGLRPYANLVSVTQLPGLAEQRVVFVDVGPTKTEIDVMANGQLAFARSADVSVPVSPLRDDDRPAESAAAVTEADRAGVTAAVRELTVEITRTLQAYRAGAPDAVMDRLVIGGGTGIEAALLEAVQKRFAPAGELFNPTTALQVRADEAEKLRSFSAALGLAWGLGREETLAIDFINPKKPIPKGAALKRRLRVGIIAAGVVLVAAAGTDLSLYLRKSRELAAQKQVVSGLKAELKNALQVENMVAEVDDWQTDAVWPEHLLQLTECAVDPGKNMIVQQMALDARTATMSLKKVLTTDKLVPIEFASHLNELKVDDKHPYRAALGGWRSLSNTESHFKGVVDVNISLLDLKKHLETRDQREKERRARLQGL